VDGVGARKETIATRDRTPGRRDETVTKP